MEEFLDIVLCSTNSLKRALQNSRLNQMISEFINILDDLQYTYKGNREVEFMIDVVENCSKLAICFNEKPIDEITSKEALEDLFNLYMRHKKPQTKKFLFDLIMEWKFLMLHLMKYDIGLEFNCKEGGLKKEEIKNYTHKNSF